jgi:hypothetical protein
MVKAAVADLSELFTFVPPYCPIGLEDSSHLIAPTQNCQLPSSTRSSALNANCNCKGVPTMLSILPAVALRTPDVLRKFARGSKIHIAEQVERFKPELYLRVVPDFEILHQAKVPRPGIVSVRPYKWYRVGLTVRPSK